MSTFYAKDSLVQDRQLKVQRLVIPFKVTSNATSANIAFACDEPGFMFAQTKGADSGVATNDAAASSAFATAKGSLSDSSGQMNILLKLNEGVSKVMSTQIVSRTDGSVKASNPDTGGTTAGISAAGNIMVYANTSINFTTTNLDACLVVEYIASGTGQ